MSSPKSPYLELGLSGHSVTYKKRAKDPRPPNMGQAYHQMQRRRSHSWSPDLHVTTIFRGVRHEKRVSNGMQTCRKCRQPKFVVDGLPCNGPKKEKK